MASLAIYIHWPFCLSKCPYCDFNSRPIKDGVDQKAWAEAYVQDIEFYATNLPGRVVRSIYFGGGTPSLMHAETVEALLNAIAKKWTLADDCEITLEANPSSVSVEKLSAFRKAGIRRISLGVQSFDDKALAFLGRAHTGKEACQAIESVASLYDRFSFDLIYARADQTLKTWTRELRQALSFAPKHLSLYQLTIELQTPFFKRAKNEKLNVDDVLAADMYEATQVFMDEAGLPAYEISSHAEPGEESSHNLTYWHYNDYMGIGPGAHGRYLSDAVRIATEAERSPAKWLSQAAPRCHQEEVGREQAQREALMMGLRLRKGIDKAAWQAKFGQDLGVGFDRENVQALVSEGLIVDNKDVFRATAEGLQRLNAVLNYLL